MKIVGYFSTSQQVTFGKTKSGHIIYQVTSFNSNIPYYLVSYGGKLKGKLIIIFNQIINNDNNLPKGQIVDVIGHMNDTNLIITLQYIYNVYRKNILYKIIDPKYDLYFKDKIIFSIDQKESIDIDDALSIEENDNYYIINVYIAQPIYWLNENLIFDRLKNSFSTLYNEPYNKNNHLWGDKITDLSSLYQDQKRPVFNVIFYINKINYIIEKIENMSCIIINKIKTNYDDCLNFDIINKLYKLTQIIYKHNIDTHEMIGYWMMKTNNYIGNNYKHLNIPFRVMKSNIVENINNISNNEIKTIFENKANESAYYSIIDNYHYKLNTFNYVHFTSPIRRIIDTIISWCIIHNNNFEELINKYNIDMDHINYIDKMTKKYHKTIKLLNNIDNINWVNDKAIIKGYIYKINIDKGKISVYFKELGFMNVKLWENKFRYLINDNIIQKLNDINMGDEYDFYIYHKKDFLPNNRIIIKASFID